jgi:hypothetical protein
VSGHQATNRIRQERAWTDLVIANAITINISIKLGACSTHFQGVLTRRQRGGGRRISPSFFKKRKKTTEAQQRHSGLQSPTASSQRMTRQRPKTNRPTLHGKNETRFAPNCPGVGGGVGRHYPAPEFARWTRLAQTREVASETSRRNMVRPLIRRVRWAGSHAFSRARARGRGRHARAQFLTVKLLPDRGRRGGRRRVRQQELGVRLSVRGCSRQRKNSTKP